MAKHNATNRLEPSFRLASDFLCREKPDTLSEIFAYVENQADPDTHINKIAAQFRLFYLVPGLEGSTMAVTHTGTVAINAAFLKEIREDNVHLRELLDAVASSLMTPRLGTVRLRALADLLGELRDQLAVHFSLEESYGYFDEAIDVPAHLSTQADILRAQHSTLFTELCEIADDAEQLVYGSVTQGDLDRVAMCYQSFCRKLREHEDCETDLILESMYDEIGVGD